MTNDEWENLQPGDLIKYKGTTNGMKARRQTCAEMVMEISKRIDGESHYEVAFICKQPYLESDWRFLLKAPMLADVYAKRS